MKLRTLLAPAIGAIMISGCGGGGGFGGGGGDLDGTLTQNDWLVGNGFYADRYLFRVDDTGTARVDMGSDFFDAYLIVIDENGNVLEDDDSGPGSDARLEFQAFEGELLEIRATSYDPGTTGPYELSWNGRLDLQGEIRGEGGRTALTGPTPKRKSQQLKTTR